MFVIQWLLMRGRALRNSLRRQGGRASLKDGVQALVLSSGLALVYGFLYMMFAFIRSKGLEPFDFAFIFLSFTLLVLLPLVFYSGIVSGLSLLFQKEEMQFYFGLPVARQALFGVKLLQTYAHTCWMVFCGLVAFLAAVQTYFKLPVAIYFTGSLAFLAYLLIPICAAVCVVLLVSRYFSFFQAKNLLTLIGLVVGSVLIAAIRVMQPEQLATQEGRMRLVTYIQNLDKPWMTFLPSEWATNVVFAQAHYNLSALAVNLAILLLCAAVFLGLAFLVAGIFFKRVWSDAALLPSYPGRQEAAERLSGRDSGVCMAFIRKDLASFFRDTLERGSLLILIPLCFVYLYSIYLLHLQISRTVGYSMFSFLFIYLFNFFYGSVVVAGLSGRWVFPSVSAEMGNFRLIRASSGNLADFVKAKFLLGFVPLFLLGQFLSLASCLILRVGIVYIVAAAVVMGVLSLGITLISLIIGTRRADFSITAPLDFALSIKAFLCLIGEFVFVAAVIGLAAVPLALYYHRGGGAAFATSATVAGAIVVSLLFFLIYQLGRSVQVLARADI